MLLFMTVSERVHNRVDDNADKESNTMKQKQTNKQKKTEKLKASHNW